MQRCWHDATSPARSQLGSPARGGHVGQCERQAPRAATTDAAALRGGSQIRASAKVKSCGVGDAACGDETGRTGRAYQGVTPSYSSPCDAWRRPYFVLVCDCAAFLRERLEQGCANQAVPRVAVRGTLRCRPALVPAPSAASVPVPARHSWRCSGLQKGWHASKVPVPGAMPCHAMPGRPSKVPE